MALEHLFRHLSPEDREAALSLLRIQVARRRRRAAVFPRIVREEKRCPRCQVTKAATEFGISRSRPDGLQGYCKECR